MFKAGCERNASGTMTISASVGDLPDCTSSSTTESRFAESDFPLSTRASNVSSSLVGPDRQTIQCYIIQRSERSKRSERFKISKMINRRQTLGVHGDFSCGRIRTYLRNKKKQQKTTKTTTTKKPKNKKQREQRKRASERKERSGDRLLGSAVCFLLCSVLRSPVWRGYVLFCVYIILVLRSVLTPTKNTKHTLTHAINSVEYVSIS